jgi:tRNA (guanine37-N1)-methyltransferase
MQIDILTLFPEMFRGPLTESMIKRGQEAGALTISIHDIRDYAEGKHRQCDDQPYGGGAGMVMMADPIVKCIEAVSEAGLTNSDQSGASHRKWLVESAMSKATPHRIYLSPRGTRLTQKKVEELSKKSSLLLLCGHYEGIDQRVIDGWIDEEISIGDYVLTGGELPAMVLIDAVARHVPGVLGKEESAMEESFSDALDGKREYPHYTRPEDFRGMKVPEVLLSGNHKKIEEWRKSQLS